MLQLAMTCTHVRRSYKNLLVRTLNTTKQLNVCNSSCVRHKRSDLFEVINIIDLIKIVVKQYIVVVFVNVVLTASGKHQPRYIVLQICLVFCLAISISLVYSQCKQLKTKVESYACKAFERAC